MSHILVSHAFRAVSIFVLFAGAAVAQHSRPASPLYDVDEAGSIWVLGSKYKAVFGAEGATYIPFFGSRAPRNFPLELKVASITAAEESLELLPEAPARRDGSMITFDRGSVLERYAVSGEGLEQSFVFTDRPAPGEIVITIDIESELVGSMHADGIRFGNELGHVSYGHAFAFDARGTSIELSTRLTAAGIEIVVPAAFAAAAALPLVVDPFISTVAVDTDANADLHPDVAVDVVSSDTLVVYELAHSATDHDILAKRYSNLVFQDATAVDLTTADWRAPKVAANREGRNWLCVAEVGASPSRIVRGRIIAHADLSLGAQFTVSHTEGGDRHSPDVGGDVNPDPTGIRHYFVVWQRDINATIAGIHGRFVQNNGTPVGIGINNFSFNSTLDTKPSISKTNGTNPAASREWIIVYQRENTPTDHDILGARLNTAGVVTNPEFSVASTSADERDPTASEPLDDHGAGRPWLAAYEVGSSLRLRAFSGAVPLQSIDITPVGSSSSLGEPDATTDGRVWQVAYRSTSGPISLIDDDVLAVSAAYADGNLVLSEEPTPIASSTFDETRPRIASTLGASNPYHCFIACESDSAVNLSDVRLGAYDSPVNADEFDYCFGTVAICPCGNGGDGSSGCGNSSLTGGARLRASGTWFVSDDTAVLTTTQLPPGAPALYFQGTANTSGAVLGDGLLCVSGTITRMAVKFAVGSISSFPEGPDPDLHVAGLVPAVGGYRFYQAWHRDSLPFCTGDLFNLTNGVALLWAP